MSMLELSKKQDPNNPKFQVYFSKKIRAYMKPCPGCKGTKFRFIAEQEPRPRIMVTCEDKFCPIKSVWLELTDKIDPITAMRMLAEGWNRREAWN